MLPPPATNAAHRLIERARAAHAAGRPKETLKFATEAARLLARPEHFYWQGMARLDMGDYAGALAVADEGLKLAPGDDPYLLNLKGMALARQSAHAQAEAVLADCVAKHPAFVPAWVGLSAARFNTEDYAGGYEAAKRAIELSPRNVAALGNAANCLKEMGRVPEAVELLRRACQIDPYHKNNRNSLLFVLLFDETANAEVLRKEAESYAAALGRQRIPGKPTPRSGGRIRIGLMSNDFKQHACSYFVLPFVANLDRSRFEVQLFCLNGYKDTITQKFGLFAEDFVDLTGKSDAEVVRTVRACQPDILLDLGGYTGVSPLQYMVHGLAPVQMSWIGYPSTTGMPSIHYRISDWVADPEGNDANYTETLLRAPTVGGVYHPLLRAPLEMYGEAYRVVETPALRNGYITFGSCNNVAKISDKTLRMWSAVLARTPGSKLLLEFRNLDTERVRAPFFARLEGAGIDVDRIIPVNRSTENQYLTYHRIDIALDTSPITGGTTTCDALWMGVPVVSLAGRDYHTRVSAPFLNAVGLGGLCCSTEDEYIALATQLAADPVELNALRLSIRPRFEQGPLFDAAAYCRWFEQQAIELVRQHRPVDEAVEPLPEGIFFEGQWHELARIRRVIAALLLQQSHVALSHLLENISTKWPRHWMIAYALAEMAHQQGEAQRAFDLLTDCIALRPYHLPLYRLLSARMESQALDRGPLADLLMGQFGLTLETVDQQPVPTIADILEVAI